MGQKPTVPTDPRRRRVVLGSSASRPAPGPIGTTGHAARILKAQNRVLKLLATGKPLEQVLTALVQSVEAQCEGAVGGVMLMDADGKHLRCGVAPRLPSEYFEAMDGIEIGPDAPGCAAAAFRREPVIVESIATDPAWRGISDLATRHGLRACWSQPILAAEGHVLGTLGVYCRTERRPATSDRQFIDATASLAGIAVELKHAEEQRREAQRRALRHKEVLVELAKSEQLRSTDFQVFARVATEAAAQALGVERVGIWLFNSERSVLRCQDLYEQSTDWHSSGQELDADTYPRYFAALERGRIVPAVDACGHADTSEFAESYLRPLNIGSMLDAPLRCGGDLIGVVCHEHVGPPREWQVDEQDFAASVADIVSLALEASRRIHVEQAFRAAQEELLRQQWQATQQVEGELQKAKEELVRQTRLATIGQVAASIAHELRNPLTAMRNADYFLQRTLNDGDPKVAEHLGIIEQEIHCADRIIGNLAEMSRARSPEVKPLDLAQAVREAMNHARETAGIRLQLSFDPDPFVVVADPDQLRQVLTNLFTNSAEALGGRGRIGVKARRRGPFDLIVVEDDGPGVPDELHGRIFEPLFTTKAKGTGLGLTICQQIARQHDGKIRLATAGDGGAAFEIRLPSPPREEGGS